MFIREFHPIDSYWERWEKYKINKCCEGSELTPREYNRRDLTRLRGQRKHETI